MRNKVFTLAFVLLALVVPLLATGAAAEEEHVRRTVVVLDPAHGGDDSGVQRESRPAEKALSLELARELQKNLQRNPNLEIILTRNQDKKKSTVDRQEIANGKQAVAFVSLHMFAGDGQASPASCFFYGHFVKDDSLAAQAGAEAAAGVRVIPWDLAQNAMLKQSRKLGAALARSWETAGPDVAAAGYSLQCAPLSLLSGLHCPAVMVEITNPAAGRSQAAGHAYCVQAAQALSRGLETFLGGR